MKKKVAQICEIHRQQDNKDFYRIVQLFLYDSIQLLSNGQLTEDEKVILNNARKMYLHELNYDLDTFKKNRIYLAEKRYSEDSITEERKNILSVINGFLTPFEEYDGGDEIDRPYELQYNIGFLKKSGLEKKELKKIFKQHFSKYLQ